MKISPAGSSFLLIAGLLILGACKPQTAAVTSPATAKPAAAAQAGPSLGRAPVWQLKDLAGKEVSSTQFQGKIVVIDFWATWCPPCRAEIPGYIELQKKYGKDGLVIVGVSLDQKGPDHVKKFVDEQGINYPVGMGTEEVVTAFGGIEAIPTTFLIDRQGEIRDRKLGAVATDDYEKRILPLLK